MDGWSKSRNAATTGAGQTRPTRSASRTIVAEEAGSRLPCAASTIGGAPNPP
jgi:hypothetical protein